MFKEIIKAIVPTPLLNVYRGLKYRQSLKLQRQRNTLRTTEDVFTEIYTKNLWGGKPGQFYSGYGSENEQIINPYIEAIKSWLQLIDASKLTVVDLGCGDFQVGQHIADGCFEYIGVDIVKDLIHYNSENFGAPGIQFRHINIITEPLPDGDVCLIRQVLQHLSNDQIKQVLKKTQKYRWVVVTEHYPSSNNLRYPNIDKPHGYDIRLDNGSGVYLDKPPFNIPIAQLELLIEVQGQKTKNSDDPGVIRTYLLNKTHQDSKA